jgi:hypothetical protein
MKKNRAVSVGTGRGYARMGHLPRSSLSARIGVIRGLILFWFRMTSALEHSWFTFFVAFIFVCFASFVVSLVLVADRANRDCDNSKFLINTPPIAFPLN